MRLAFEPLIEGETGLVFVNQITGGAIPKEFVPSIEKALKAALLDGGPGGVPVLGMRATLLDGAFHEKDSSGLAFAGGAPGVQDRLRANGAGAAGAADAHRRVDAA